MLARNFHESCSGLFKNGFERILVKRIVPSQPAITCSTLTIKTPERRHEICLCVFINFELVFLWLTLVGKYRLRLFSSLLDFKTN